MTAGVRAPKITKRNPPYRVRITQKFRLRGDSIVYIAEGVAELPFTPFAGLVLKFKGGYHVPFKGTTKVTWNGVEFGVECTTVNLENQEDLMLWIENMASANFNVWWPYDRKAHIQRIRKQSGLHIVK